MKAFLTAFFPSGKGHYIPTDPTDPDPPVYDNYIVNIFKVIDNYVNGQLSANTGLSYDKNRRLIYSGVTPLNAVSTGIYILNEQGVYQGQLPVFSIQGFDYDPIRDQFIVWSQGNANATLRTFAYDGTQLYRQNSFDPFIGKASGTVCYDYIDDVLLFSTDNGGDIPIYVRSGNDWIFDRYLGATMANEGITFDEKTNTYWYNRSTELVNISKQGVELRTIPQVAETTGTNEGIAWNPHKNTIYVNSDKGYHGGIPDGNRCIELWPDFYK